LLADECTDISTIEELSIVICWVENGLPVEYFTELVLLKKADASTIYETLTDCLKKKGLVIGNMIGMGFDGAATFFWQAQWSSSPIKQVLVFKLQTILKVSNMFTRH